MVKQMSTPESRNVHSVDQRRATRVGPELERSLSAYAGAALAAGVSLLAITVSAEGKIVYTPADVTIPVNGGPVPLDLNHDGIADFVLSNVFLSATSYPPSSIADLNVAPASSHSRNQFWGRRIATKLGRRTFASALRPHFTVRASKSYFHKATKGIMAGLSVFFEPFMKPQGSTSCSGYPGGGSSTNGQWMYVNARYLGLKFEIKGEIHYGWARLAVTRNAIKIGENSIGATLTGYAYETVSNKPIVTGKTKGMDVITLSTDARWAVLGHLAQGRK
jgi:hypothetical protein